MFGFKRSQSTTWRDRFAQQNTYEAEGAAAGLAGKMRDDCPYSRTEQTEAWNFWVYGCDVARSEVNTIVSGEVMFLSTEAGAKPFGVPVREAIESGKWKPKWARFDST